MVRATEKTRAILKKYSEMEGRSQVELLQEAVETWERLRLLSEMKAGFEAVYADPASRAVYEQEAALYENSVSDGLEEGS